MMHRRINSLVAALIVVSDPFLQAVKKDES